MNSWYYAHGGTQHGPVSLEQLRDLAASGNLDAKKDLVWNSGMTDWLPAGEVSGIFSPAAAERSTPEPAPTVTATPTAGANPYAAPITTANLATISENGLTEIPPGSEPLQVGACISRAFELTTRNFGLLLLTGLAYSGALIVTMVILGLLIGATQPTLDSSAEPSLLVLLGIQVVLHGVSLFLGLGVIRIVLNVVSGRAASVGQLFSQGDKLLRAAGAGILFAIAASLGLMLFVIPGIYLMLRYGQFLNAIVDRDMSIMEAFAYSSSITTNNRLNMFVVGLASMGIIILGFLALIVGLFFAYPMVILLWIVAYRWMQYGAKVSQDHPGTRTPLLAPLPGSGR